MARAKLLLRTPFNDRGCFFSLYALESEHGFYNLVVGLATYVTSAVVLIGATVKRST